jgi:transposase InsO family protein
VSTGPGQPQPQTVRAECLDWLLILGRSHLERALRIFVAHYNHQRPHRALALHSPEANAQDSSASAEAVERRDLLGGLIHEYHPAAA